MSLSEAEVLHVAQLAKLELTPEEIARFRGQLSAILDAAKALEALDVSGVAPTTHAGLSEGPLRPDARVPSLTAEEALANAPRRTGDSFQVPRVLE